MSLDIYAQEILDALESVFTLELVPDLPEKPEALAPVLALGLALTTPASHIPVPVPFPRGLTPDPLVRAITAPANCGPASFAPSNPVPDSDPKALAPPGPAQQGSRPPVPWDYPSRGGRTHTQ